jgi:NAD+ kinase
MAAIALVVHHDRPNAAALARETVTWLHEQGHEVRLLDEDAEAADLDELGRATDELLDGLELAVSLGGDGTMLRTVDTVAAHDVPVLGVNFGQLAYLAQVEPDGLRDALEAFLRAEHQIEERMLLAVEVACASGEIPPTRELVLNEAVVEKAASGHTVRLQVEIDGKPFTPYTADGLIVATPTGSTAYNLSARGPIVDPLHRAILMTPVSPHMLFDRTLVLGPDAQVTLTVGGTRPGIISVDGRLLGTLAVGDSVTCRASHHCARLVTFGARDFHGILKAKFKLSDR